MVKDTIVSAPILRFPNWNKSFHVCVDALGVSTNNFLTHVDDEKIGHMMYFARKKLSLIDNNYNTIEWETLGMVYYTNFDITYYLTSSFLKCKS
jgi:hypothetical protein